MFKKGGSFRKIFSRSKTKKKSKEDKYFQRNVDSTSFQEIILTQNYAQQTNREAQPKAIRDESTVNERSHGIRKREGLTITRPNTTQRKYKSHNNMLGEVSAASNSNGENFTRFEGVPRVEICLHDKKSKAGRFAEDLPKQRADLNSALFKSSNDKLSSASSSEGQPRKARDVDGRVRKDNVVPRHERKSEKSSVVEGITEENMASLYAWVKDTNRTVHDMQRCLVEIKSEILGLTGSLQIRQNGGSKDSDETQPDFEIKLENNVQQQQLKPSKQQQEQEPVQKMHQPKQQQRQSPQQVQQQPQLQQVKQQEQLQQVQQQTLLQQQPQQGQQQQLQHQVKQQEHQQPQQQVQELALPLQQPQQVQQQQQHNEEHQPEKQGQDCHQKEEIQQEQTQATKLSIIPTQCNEINSKKQTKNQNTEQEYAGMNEISPDATAHHSVISDKPSVPQDTGSTNSRDNGDENKAEVSSDPSDLQSDVKEPNAGQISNLTDDENTDHSISLGSPMCQEEGAWVQKGNFTEPSTEEVDGLPQELCRDYHDVIRCQDRDVAGQSCANARVCTLVNDLVQQLDVTICRFFDRLGDLDGEVTHKQSKKACGCKESIKRSNNEYVGFYGNRKERLCDGVQRCIKRCPKQRPVCQVPYKTTTSSTLISHTQTDTFDKEDAILASCKCTCHLNRRGIRDANVSSGYLSEDASSGGTSLLRSDFSWQKMRMAGCTPTLRSYAGWGITGNDFVQRHIVTSSPIIASLRDLKPQEI